MDSSSPLPRSLVLLVFLLPALLLSGLGVARRLTSDRALGTSLAPAIALAAWLTSVHLCGLATHSFTTGLTLGTIFAALPAPLLWRSGPSWDATAVERRVLAVRAGVVLLATVPVVRMAFGFAFHDEDLFTGHMSIAAEIGNGIYPPRHLTFANVELGYHYGFDLLTACIAAIFRTRVDVAIDLATTSLWMLSAWLLGALGELWLRRGRGWIAILTTLFAGGVARCLEKGDPKVPAVLGFCTVRGETVVSPVVSNFFQHPWGLGIPLALAALIVFSIGDSARSRERPTARLLVLSLLFVALSIGHIVLFATLLPTLFAIEAWIVWRDRRPLREKLTLLASAGLAVGGAIALGGFFRAPPWGASSPFDIRLGVVPGLWGSVLWHAQSFGLLLPAALVGIFLLRGRARAATALLIGGSFVVLSSLHYRYSGDTVKFGVVAAIAMGLASAATIDALLSVEAKPGASGSPGGRGLLRRLAAVALLVATSAAGLGFALFFSLFPEDAAKVFKTHVPQLAGDDASAAAFLRARVRAGEIVFRREGAAVGYAVWAGLPIPWVDWGVTGFGFPRAWIQERLTLIRALPPEPEKYRAQGIVWFVLEPGDAALQKNAEQWIADGKAVEAATFGSLRVIRLTT